MTDQSGAGKADSVREKIAEQAFEWLLQLDEPDEAASSREKFAAWLKESPVHVEELLTLQATWHALDRAALNSTARISELVSTAQAKVVPLEVDRAFNSTRPRTVRRVFTRRWFVAAAAAVPVMVASGVLIARYIESRPDVYSTRLGEQSSFTLLDGSVVHLNTRSKLRIRFTDEGRNAELLRGEALFQVARDPDRPFRVMAADTVFEAIGTSFNVHKSAYLTTMTVVEGKVAVRRRDDAPSFASENAGAVGDLTLLAGEQVAIDPGGAVTRREGADTREATAWRQRRLIFRNDTLVTIAEQFNRYNRLRIEVTGSAATRQVTGVFDADDPESMVEFLIDEPSIRVTRDNHQITISDR